MSHVIPERIDPAPIRPTKDANVRWVEHHITTPHGVTDLEWVAYHENGYCAGSVWKGWSVVSDSYHVVYGWPLSCESEATADTLEAAQALVAHFDRTGQRKTGHFG